MTYLSPLHATFILFADFVFDPAKANTQGWIAFGITIAIWGSLIGLYFLITLKLIKQNSSSDFYAIQTFGIYLVLYIASTIFVILYLIMRLKTRDLFILAG